MIIWRESLLTLFHKKRITHTKKIFFLKTILSSKQQIDQFDKNKIIYEFVNYIDIKRYTFGLLFSTQQRRFGHISSFTFSREAYL